MNCTIPFLAIKRISYVIIVINLIFPLILLGQFRVVYSGSDPNNSIQKVHFLSPSTGYAGFEKYIGYTQDSGHTFLKQYITPDKVDFNGYDPEFFWGFWVNGIYAINDMNILVYGTYGFGSAVLFSNNRGATFKLVYYYDQQYYYENPGVNKVHFPQGTSFAGYALEYNSILKTNNGGINWSRIYYNPNANFKDLIFFNSSQGYAVNNGVLQKTTNGGTSWTTVATPGDYVNSISFLDFERGYITRERNLYFTENGGQTWQLVNDNNLYPVLGQVKFIDAAKGYVLGQEYTLYLTNDSGKIWEPLPRNNSFSYLGYTHNDIYFYGSNQIWAAGDHEFLELSTNGGGNPKPVSRFKVDLSEINSLNKVNLINYSSLNAQYYWYLNSGLISNAYTASYQTARLSIDTVKLIVTRNGFSDTSVTIIDTRPDPRPCSAAFVTQVDTGTVYLSPSYHQNGVIHKWFFGDGTFDTLSVQPRHTYASVGIYKVIHRVINTIDNCTAIDSTTVQIIRTQNCLVPTFTFSADSFYTNSIKFEADWDKTKESASGPVSLVTWTWGDSSQQDGNMIHYHEYEKNGDYRASVSLRNYYTGCTANSAIKIVQVRMDTICNAAFNTKIFTGFNGFYYRYFVFNGKPLAIKAGKRHIYLINNTLIADSSYPNTSHDFFRHTSENFFNYSGNDCGNLTAEINIDSISKTITHIVIDSIKGCADTVSKPFNVPRLKNVFIRPVPYPEFPSYVRFEFYEKAQDGSTHPYYSRSAIDNLYSGGFSGPGADSFKTFLFIDTGIHRIAIASNNCTFSNGEREVYFMYYKPAPLPACPIFPPDFSFSKIQNQSNVFEFINLSYSQNYKLDNTFMWYFGDGDSSFMPFPQHNYAVPGTYQVKLFYKNPSGCTREIVKQLLVSGTVTSLDTVTGLNSRIRLRPNPVSNYLYIDNPLPSNKLLVAEVYNVSGMKMTSSNLFIDRGGSKINVEKLPSGFYILSLRQKNSAPIFLSFVKQ